MWRCEASPLTESSGRDDCLRRRVSGSRARRHARAQQKPDAVTSEQLLAGQRDQSQWLMFGGDYSGRRHSPLTQVTPQNVNRLAHQWTFQTGTLGDVRDDAARPRRRPLCHRPQQLRLGARREDRPIVLALPPELPDDLRVCCGPVNRGFAMLGNRLFMTTLDAHLVALDARTGEVLFDVVLDDYKKGYASTIAPLVVKNKVIVGVAGGEYGAPGFIDAYDVETGNRVWRVQHRAGPGRVGQRNLAGRFGRARRRRRLGHRQLRSGAEPGVFTAPAILRPTSTARTAKATTCSAIRCSRSTPTPASGDGTTSSRRTTPTTGIRPTCRSSPS